MNFIDKMVERFLKLNRRMKRWQRVVSVMAAVVVFATTYALVLPAITLDTDTASTQAGIEVAAGENVPDEAGTVFESEEEEPAAEEEPVVEEEEPEEAAAEENSSSESGSQEAEAAVTEAAAENNADEIEQTEVLTTEEAATYSTTEAAIAAVTGKTAEEVKLITEDTQLTFAGSDYVVYADFGASAKLPEGVQLKVREITKESDPEAYNAYYEKALSEMQDKYDNITDLSFARFYDISFVYEGVEIEPSGNVNVRIEYKKAEEIKADANVETIHFDKNNDEQPEVISSDANVKSDELKSVEFESDQFSVYAVVVPGDESEHARLKVNFYGEDRETPVATIYVKNSDKELSDEDFNVIVYDPGVGDLDEYSHFKGWVIGEENKDYSTTTSTVDINGVRDYIKDMAQFKEGDVLDIYGVIIKSYTIKYLDELSTDTEEIALKTDTVQIPAYETENPTYTVDEAYTPRHQDDVFTGWQVTNGADNISPVSGEAPADNVYQNGTEVTISGDVTFGASVPTGYWLSFEGNGRGASYTPPQFVRSTQTTTRPSDPTRQGYTFGGWYDNAACTGDQFVFGRSISERTTLYAKWNEAATAKYHVIIWRQNLDGESYDFEESIELTGNVNSTVNTVTASGSGNNRYASVNGTSKRYTGFHLKEYDTGKTIATEGTTIVNVYYDRNEHTFTFQRNNSTIHTVTRLYGQDISDIWSFTGSDGRTYPQTNPPTSWTPHGSTTYTARITRMEVMPDEDIRFTHTTSSNTIRYFHYYVQALPGATGTRQWNGMQYSLYTDLTHDFNLIYYNDDFWNLDGFTRQAIATANGTNVTSQIGSGTSWNRSWNSNLYFYYTRNQYDIIYRDGRYFDSDGNPQDEVSLGEIAKDEGVYYQLDISSYGDNHKPTRSGYTFAGWFKDETCTEEYTFSEMPSHNVTVYAKWIKTEYRVFLHPNVPADAVNYELAQGQATSFRVSSGKKVNDGQTVQAMSKNYELIGWYRDEACTEPFNFDAFILNDTNVTEAYDQTEPTELDDHGQPTSQENKDAANNRFWIKNKLNLYAKWRSVLEGAKGIDIVYDAGDGSHAPADSTKYLDRSTATAQAASTAPEGKVFSRWVLQTWNGSEYVKTGTKILPGNTFTVNKSDAKPIVSVWVNPNDSSDVIVVDNPTPGTTPPDAIHTDIKTATYTIQLVAEYVDKEEDTPTHIYFYANTQDKNGDPIPNITDANQPKDEDTYKEVQINDAKQILAIDQVLAKDTAGVKDNYTNYVFLGWAKSPDATEPWLKLQENGKYSVTQDGNNYTDIEFIAADELQGEYGEYDNLYAVWERTYKLTVKKVVVGTSEDQNIDFEFSVVRDSEEPTTFVLKHGGSKDVFEDLNKGTHFSVTETENVDFEISVTGKYIDSKGDEHVIANLTNGADITTQGDTEITVTNTRKAKKVKVFKTDDLGNPLEGVDFTLNGETLTTNEEGFTNTLTLNASDTAYTLTETSGKDHYSKLSGNVSVLVGSNGVTATAAEGDADKVTVSGPDQEEVYTITVVNPRERYTVNIEKRVSGIDSDNDIEFAFNSTGMTESEDSFELKGREGENTKTYREIPYGTIITVSETANDDFDTSIAITNGVESIEVSSLATGSISVNGNVNIIYTNARNKQLVKVFKVETGTQVGLGGAVFSLTGPEGTEIAYENLETNDEGWLVKDGQIFMILPVNTSAYTLEETKAPEGYKKIGENIQFTVSSNGVAGAEEELDDNNKPTGYYVITVQNSAGEELPKTGGPGTLHYTLSGMILIIASAMMYGFRMRRRERRIN